MTDRVNLESATEMVNLSSISVLLQPINQPT